jgi:hypothetical protein
MIDLLMLFFAAVHDRIRSAPDTLRASVGAGAIDQCSGSTLASTRACRSSALGLFD